MLGASLVDGNRELLWQLPASFRRSFFDTNTWIEFIDSDSVDTRRKPLLSQAETRRERRFYDLQGRSLSGLLRWNDRNHMSFSVEPRYPLLDNRVVELCLRFRHQILYRNGWTKNALRLGFEDLLPQVFARRRSETANDRIQSEWIYRAIRPAVEQMLEDSAAPLWSYLPRDEVRKVSNRVFMRPDAQAHRSEALFRAFNLNRWMRVFELTR
jgi:asparagine synthetase B (glutamine-hydrolysing)